jgi:hypothetical protein
LRLDGVTEEMIALLKSQVRPDIIPNELLEEPSEETIRTARSKWEKIDKSSLSKNCKMHVKWLETAAHVARVYPAQEVVTAFIELGLFSATSYGQDLTDAQVSKLLPKKEFLPEMPWSRFVPVRHHMCHTITIPASCSGSFIGVGGANSRAFTLQLQEHAAEIDVLSAPRVQLNVRLPNGKRSRGTVELHIYYWAQYESPLVARSASLKVAAIAKEFHQVVIQRINEIFVRRLTILAHRRNKRAERFQEAGRAYHETKRHARRERLNAKDDSACRGLELPPEGISRKNGNPSLNRKDVGKQRRRALLWEKRKHALQACCVLGFFDAPCFEDRSSITVDAPWRCGLLSDAQIRKPSKEHNGRVTGVARRMLKHLSSCSDESASKALDNLASVRKAADRPVKQPKHRQQKLSRQQNRMTDTWMQTESAAVAESAEPEWATEPESAAKKDHAQQKLIMSRTLGLFMTDVHDCRRRPVP